ncbi:hypothetical protein PRNP1_008154 [Phytophthora ramorum]
MEFNALVENTNFDDKICNSPLTRVIGKGSFGKYRFVPDIEECAKDCNIGSCGLTPITDFETGDNNRGREHDYDLTEIEPTIHWYIERENKPG